MRQIDRSLAPRIIGLSAFALLTLAGPVAAQPARQHTDAANTRAALALGRTHYAVDYARVPLTRALQDLQQRLGIELRVDWATLARSGVKPDQTVTIALQSVAAETLLRILLDEAGGADARLGFAVRDGSILISTQTALRGPLVLHTYAAPTASTARGSAAGSADNAPSCAVEFASLLQQIVEPDAWESNGGAEARMRVDANTLLIETRPELHARIRAVLLTLRTRPTPHTRVYSAISSRSTRTDDAIRAALERELEDVSYDKRPLHAVIANLRQRLRINLHVSWRCLADAGIEPDTPISLTLRGLPAERVLQIVLDESADPYARPGYEIRDGVLVVTTREPLEYPSEVHAHSLADLHLPTPTAPPSDPNAPTPPPWEELTELIIQAVEPDTWADNGGLGTIQVFGDVLFTRNNRRVCRQVTDLLRLLESPLPNGHAQLASRVTPLHADEAIHLNLQRTLPPLSFEERPLDTVLADLLKRVDANAYVDWPALVDAGIERDTPIDADLTGLSIEQALRLVLARAGADIVLGYEIHDGVLVIGTLESLCKEMELHVYQLDRRDPNQTRHGRLDPERAAREAERHIDLIVRTVYPDSWAENGGLGTIQSFDRFLVVRSNPRTCRTITSLLRTTNPD